MRFFRRSPAPEPPPHRVHHPWNPPEAEFPGIAPIDTLHFDRSERAAIAIIGIAAYARGFEFFLARRIRPGTPGLDEDPTPDALRRGLTEPQSFQISLQFSDGRMAVSGRSRGDSEPTGPILQSRGGGGTSHSQLLRWWAWPLPPAGPLEFICQWPMFGIGETRVGIDAQVILDAARRSIQLWPEEEDLPSAVDTRRRCMRAQAYPGTGPLCWIPLIHPCTQPYPGQLYVDRIKYTRGGERHRGVRTTGDIHVRRGRGPRAVTAQASALAGYRRGRAHRARTVPAHR
jgi:hypothetical protein